MRIFKIIAGLALAAGIAYLRYGQMVEREMRTEHKARIQTLVGGRK
ncbi:MAG: hypothetical protein JOZ83_05165 [Silvibacterium sp.]|nr:hypothetical protein [Silvibacterium sp.]